MDCLIVELFDCQLFRRQKRYKKRKTEESVFHFAIKTNETLAIGTKAGGGFLKKGDSFAGGQFINIGGAAAQHGLVAPHCNGGSQEGWVVHDDV